MIKPINFTGIYRFPKSEVKQNKKGKISLIHKALAAPEVKKQEEALKKLDGLNDKIFKYKINYKLLNKSKAPTNLGYKIFVVCPNDIDVKVDEICTETGVKYQKTETVSMSLDEVMDKIAPAPEGKELVMINPDELDFIVNHTYGNDTNIPQCKFSYTVNQAQNVNNMLSGNDKIPATTLYIRPSGKSFNGYEVMFKNETEQPDECVYFALKNLGLKKIPVYVDTTTSENSYENSTECYARRLHLICDDEYRIYD